MATLTAHYSNFFDTWEGRKQATATELIATIPDDEIAWQILETVHRHLIDTTDTFDYVELSMEIGGVENWRSLKAGTAGYTEEARAHSASFTR